MIQVILKAAFNAGWTAGAQYVSLAGDGQIPFGATFGINYTNLVMPISGTFRNLVVYSADTHPDYAVTIMHNNVASTLTALLPAGSDIASSSGGSASVVAGDTICVRVQVAVPGSGSGYDVSIGVEFDADQQIYGLQPFSGSVSSSNPATMGRRGGMLLNGDFEVAPVPISGTLSNTYSIVSVAGSVTKMVMKTFGGAPLTGTWTGYLILNGILQDGTGGTVDTSLVMTGSSTYVTTTFALPVVLGDHLEFIVVRGVINAPNMPAQVCASIAFTPTSGESFMNTGGSGDSVSSAVPTYLWNRSEPLTLIETAANVPIPSRGINVTGLYVEIRTPSGPGNSFTYVIRKNGADTAATVTITHPNLTGQITGLDIDFAANDVMTLKITPDSTPISTDHYWGLISLLESPVNPLSGIYEVIPNKRNDTLWVNFDPEETEDVKIPRPYARTGLIGE